MVRRVEETDPAEENDAVDPYEEVSERLDIVRVKETDVVVELPPSLSSPDCRMLRTAGGTSCTWRFKG